MSCWALLALSLLLPCLPHPSDVSTLFIFDPVDDLVNPVDDPLDPQVFVGVEFADEATGRGVYAEASQGSGFKVSR